MKKLKQFESWFKKHQKVLYLVLAIFISALAFFFGENIEFVKNFGYLGVFIINLVGSATLIFPTPYLIVVVAAGAFLNPFLVAFFSALGASIGELTGYMAGAGGEELIVKNKWFSKTKTWMDKNGILTLFVFAAIPNPFFDVAGMIAGATEMSVKKYLIVVFCGKLIKFLVFAYIGSGSFHLIDRFV